MKYLELNPDKLEEALKLSTQSADNRQADFLSSKNNSSLSPNQNGLKELTFLASSLRNLPKNEVSRPYKAYRFAESITQQTSFWSRYSRIVRLGVIPLSLVLILGGTVVANATQNSLPGDTLYSLKRASEEARLSLTLNEEKIAYLHIEYAQKRLEEIKKVIDTKDTKNENLAIAALKEQTEKTIAEVSQIALSRAVNNDESLLNNLVAINEGQKEILNSLDKLPETEDTTLIAITSTEENGKTLAGIKASADKQNKTTPSEETINDVVVSIIDGKMLKLEKNTIELSSETIIVNSEGAALSQSNLKPFAKISVIAYKNSSDQLIAKKIILLPATTTTPLEPVVKGILTTKKSYISSPTTQTKQVETIQIEPEPINQAVGGFIVEPSEKQFTE